MISPSAGILDMARRRNEVPGIEVAVFRCHVGVRISFAYIHTRIGTPL